MTILLLGYCTPVLGHDYIAVRLLHSSVRPWLYCC